MTPRLNWRAELVLLGLAIAETAALWIVVSLLLSPADGVVLAGVLFALVYGAALMPRLLDSLDVRNPVLEALMAIAVLVTTLFAVKVMAFPQLPWLAGEWLRQTIDALILRDAEARVSIWGIVAVSAYAWWRGRRAEPSLDTAYAALRYGTAVVLVGVLVHSLAGAPVGERALSAALLLFFAASLAAIAVARIQAARDEGRRQGEPSLGPVSVLTVLAPVLVVLAGAIVAAGVFTRTLLDTVIWALSPLIWALSLLLRGLVLVLAVVTFVIIWPIFWLLSRLQADGEPVAPDAGVVGEPNGLQREIERAIDVPDPIRYLIAATVLLVLFWVVTRFALRRRRASDPVTGEERESVLDLDAGTLLNALLQRLRRIGADGGERGPDPLAGLRGDPRWVHTVVIRETYQALLARFRERGVAREPATTPREYGERLASTLVDPTALDDLRLITDRYNGTRYGDEPASAAEAEEVRAAWRRLEGGMSDT